MMAFRKKTIRPVKTVKMIAMGLLLISVCHGYLLPEAPENVKVLVSYANVRQEPSVQSAAVAVVRKGDLLKVLGKKDGWYHVQFTVDGEVKKGYIFPDIVGEVTQKKPKVKKSRPKLPSEPVSRTPVPRDIRQKDLGFLQKIEAMMRKRSMAFLVLVKKMAPKKSSGYILKTVETARVVVSNCKVYETMDPSSRVLYYPRINSEFQIESQSDGLYKVRLTDGRKGWISESCIQLFSKQKREPKVTFTGVEPDEIRQFVEMSSDIFAKISQLKTVADKIYDKYAAGTAAEKSTLKMIRVSYAKISKYYEYSFYFYDRYVEKNTILLAKDTSVLSKISAWGELLIGSSNFETKYLGTSVPDSEKGMTRSISLGGNYVINEKSRVNMTFSNVKDIVQTPYTNTAFDTGYDFTKSSKLRLHAGVSLNSYQDEANNLNDFSRVGFRTHADYLLTPKTHLNFNYSFLSNSFSNTSGNNYSTHNILAGAKLNMNRTDLVQVKLRGSFESGDSMFHQFSDIEPSVAYFKNRQNSQLNVTLGYQMLGFKELEYNSFNRLGLSLQNSSRRQQNYSTLSLGVTSKNYPNSEANNYLQFRGRYSTNRFGEVQRNAMASFYTTLMSNNPESSFTDIKFSFGNTTRRFFSEFSTYFKLWHDPTGANGNGDSPVKPYVLDLYTKVGVSTEYFRMGPTVGMHMLISSEKGVALIKRDGNVFRVGGVAELRIPLPRKILFTLNAAYDYGFVYSDQITIDPGTGEIDSGDVVQRHPTTLQVNSTIQAPISDSLELFGRGSLYRIDTKMDDVLSINPIEYNKRFVVVFGVRYRHN